MTTTLGLFWWFMVLTDISGGFQGNVGPFLNQQDCEEHRVVYASKFFGWISRECGPTPVVLVPTGGVQQPPVPAQPLPQPRQPAR